MCQQSRHRSDFSGRSKCATGERTAQRLLEGCFNALGDLTDAGLQPFVFGDQRIATEYACHAAIALGKGH